MMSPLGAQGKGEISNIDPAFQMLIFLLISWTFFFFCIFIFKNTASKYLSCLFFFWCPLNFVPEATLTLLISPGHNTDAGGSAGGSEGQHPHLPFQTSVGVVPQLLECWPLRAGSLPPGRLNDNGTHQKPGEDRYLTEPQVRATGRDGCTESWGNGWIP